MQQLSNRHLNTITTVFVLIAFMLGCNEFMVVGNLTLIAHTYHESLPPHCGIDFTVCLDLRPDDAGGNPLYQPLQ